MRCFIVLVHESLETHVSRFLELHVVVKSVLDQLVNLLLKRQQ